MATTLRLPPRLDSLARIYAADLGISVHAFVSVALDRYFREVPPPPPDVPAADTAAPPGGPSSPATGGKSGKVSGKKETFKDRQSARDTAFQEKKK